jgi:hypothetical protein
MPAGIGYGNQIQKLMERIRTLPANDPRVAKWKEKLAMFQSKFRGPRPTPQTTGVTPSGVHAPGLNKPPKPPKAPKVHPHTGLPKPPKTPKLPKPVKVPNPHKPPKTPKPPRGPRGV